MISAIKVYSNERGFKVLKEGTDLEEYKKRYPSTIVVKEPSYRILHKWVCEGVAYTPCRCKVEPDGYCRHGRPSWLIVLGVIW